MQMQVDSDAFASGQIGSKLWLCEVLEQIWAANFGTKPATIWVLGGWYAVLPFMLFTRNILPIETIRSFDIDDSATQIANKVGNLWESDNWRFRAITQDVNTLSYSELIGKNPIVINTSSEHMSDTAWFERIPSSCMTVIQNTDMPLDDHVSRCMSLEEMAEKFPLREVWFSGSIEFKYPDWSFTRYMRIGYR